VLVALIIIDELAMEFVGNSATFSFGDMNELPIERHPTANIHSFLFHSLNQE
jgi:hypothetical protein